jgi:hypothetical protein
MSIIIVSWFQPELMADNSGQWCANCLTIISWARKGRKENIYYSLHCAQTLHFNMVMKVSVASTRTPWLNQHLPWYQLCDPAPTRLQCTWYWKLEPFSDLAVNETQLSYQDVVLVTDHVNSPTVKLFHVTIKNPIIRYLLWDKRNNFTMTLNHWFFSF